MAGLSEICGPVPVGYPNPLNQWRQFSEASGRALRNSLFDEDCALRCNAKGKEVRAKVILLLFRPLPFPLCPSPPSVLLNYVPMHPNVGLRFVTSFKEYAAGRFARNRLHPRRNVFLLLGSFRVIKKPP